MYLQERLTIALNIGFQIQPHMPGSILQLWMLFHEVVLVRVKASGCIFNWARGFTMKELAPFQPEVQLEPNVEARMSNDQPIFSGVLMVYLVTLGCMR